MLEHMDATDVAFNYKSRFANDAVLAVRFYSVPVQDKPASLEQGRPIFKDVDYIEIHIPGSKDSIVRRPATRLDLQRFSEHYSKYKARTANDDTVTGTPLAEWPGATRSQVEELAFFNIRTVEQLAGMSDGNAQQVMGVAMLKQKAAEYLQKAEAKDYGELKEQMAKAQAEIAALRDKLGASEGAATSPELAPRPAEATTGTENPAPRRRRKV